MTAQNRLSAVSIPSNIAEEPARKGVKENIQFLYIALGSMSKLETQLLIATRLKYTNQSDTLNKMEGIRRVLLN